jgi:hypothetical protein
LKFEIKVSTGVFSSTGCSSEQGIRVKDDKDVMELCESGIVRGDDDLDIIDGGESDEPHDKVHSDAEPDADAEPNVDAKPDADVN